MFLESELEFRMETVDYFLPNATPVLIGVCRVPVLKYFSLGGPVFFHEPLHRHGLDVPVGTVQVPLLSLLLLLLLQW